MNGSASGYGEKGPRKKDNEHRAARLMREKSRLEPLRQKEGAKHLEGAKRYFAFLASSQVFAELFSVYSSRFFLSPAAAPYA